MPRPGKFGFSRGRTNDETSAKTMNAAATSARPISWPVVMAAITGVKKSIARATLDHERAVVVIDRLAGHPQRVRGQEPGNRTGDLGRLAHSTERHLAHRDLERLVARHPRERIEPFPGHLGVHPARADRVHLDLPWGELRGEGAHQPEQRRLRRAVPRVARHADAG